MMIQIQVPTTVHSEEEIKIFYQTPEKETSAVIAKRDMTITLGNWNVKLSTDA